MTDYLRDTIIAELLEDRLRHSLTLDEETRARFEALRKRMQLEAAIPDLYQEVPLEGHYDGCGCEDDPAKRKSGDAGDDHAGLMAAQITAGNAAAAENASLPDGEHHTDEPASDPEQLPA